MSKDDFKEGEYIVYANGEKYELGRIKTLREDGAFVAYHEGETGAKTPYDTMHKLINNYVIEKTSLGGEYFKEQEEEPKVYCKDCARRHNDCPLQLWCGPQDDDFCSRGEREE